MSLSSFEDFLPLIRAALTQGLISFEAVVCFPVAFLTTSLETFHRSLYFLLGSANMLFPHSLFFFLL